mmetsp:Transcript_2584/g.6016  ORF Transcript_2584/g.6016 Transcript_2584/m.6016 type:complete len:594 (-) Transcript_2584:174-1955(-)|eukprot:CAMPEP_0171550806 /NCGR_PEP_ID=MMETSP0960-20121227/7298_1 /TAXON_ID=87120 /ORGANISM="Aurantiochytrium limacinum, Strain ATCCMYA-1381" /LENGTH=593 /DNA_ID=CAMNT_0012099841 /DNA_START=51 /DNA_END=1832 /DNA_ORIENTATION=+
MALSGKLLATGGGFDRKNSYTMKRRVEVAISTLRPLLLFLAAVVGVSWLITAHSVSVSQHARLLRQKDYISFQKPITDLQLLKPQIPDYLQVSAAPKLAESTQQKADVQQDEEFPPRQPSHASFSAEDYIPPRVEVLRDQIDYSRIEELVSASRDSVLTAIAQLLSGQTLEHQEDIIPVPPVSHSPSLEIPKKRKQLAVLVTGEARHLEIQSKIRNVVQPQIDAGYDVHVIFVLDAFQKAINPADTPTPQPYPSPYSLVSWADQEIEAWARRNFHLARDDEVTFNIQHVPYGSGQRTRKIIFGLARTEKEAFFNFHCVLRYNETESVLQKPRTKVQQTQSTIYSTDFQIKAKRMRKAMIYLESLEHEQQISFDVVMHMNENSVAFAPFRFPDVVTSNDFVTNTCLHSQNGLNWNDFVVGRARATEILRGLAEHRYFSSKDMSDLTPAKYFQEVVRAADARITVVPECDWSIAPIVFEDQGNGEFEAKWPTRFQESVKMCESSWIDYENQPIEQCSWRSEVVFPFQMLAQLRLDLIQRDTVGPQTYEAIRKLDLPWPQTEDTQHQPLSKYHSPLRVLPKNRKSKRKAGEFFELN